MEDYWIINDPKDIRPYGILIKDAWKSHTNENCLALNILDGYFMAWL